MRCHFNPMIKIFIFFGLLISTTSFAQKTDALKGKWMSLPNEGLLINVYKVQGIYKGKIKWAKDKDKAKAGFLIIDDLVYDPETKTWENGKIFDPKGGEYNASAKINDEGILVVRAYKGMKFLGTDKFFKRVK